MLVLSELEDNTHVFTALSVAIVAINCSCADATCEPLVSGSL